MFVRVGSPAHGTQSCRLEYGSHKGQREAAGVEHLFKRSVAFAQYRLRTPFPIHSNTEIAPPIEGLSVNRKRPDMSVTEGFISKLFTGEQLRWG